MRMQQSMWLVKDLIKALCVCVCVQEGRPRIIEMHSMNGIVFLSSVIPVGNSAD